MWTEAEMQVSEVDAPGAVAADGKALWWRCGRDVVVGKLPGGPGREVPNWLARVTTRAMHHRHRGLLRGSGRLPGARGSDTWGRLSPT